MAWGDRKETRVFFEHAVAAQMIGIDGSWRRECHLADVSASGAKLIVFSSMQGLKFKEFFLLLTPTGATVRRCELVRVSGDEIGVRFLKKGDVRNPAQRPIPKIERR